LRDFALQIRRNGEHALEHVPADHEEQRGADQAKADTQN
jgi:hypothetical protein